MPNCCKNCKWWLESSKNGTDKQKDLAEKIQKDGGNYRAGFCIRFPPAYGGNRAGWVTTRPDDYCGEYEPVKNSANMETETTQTIECAANYITIEVLAARLHLPLGYVKSLAAQNKIPHLKVGKRWRRYNEWEVRKALVKLE
jgi:excisionase family DNA binding protein